jgi:hypothetical protein
MVHALRPEETIQNDLYGAFVLYHFVLKAQEHQEHGLVPIHNLFYVIPIVANWHTRNMVERTKKASGVFKFIGKMMDNREVLIEFHQRTKSWRHYSWSSIVMANNYSLISIDVRTASAFADQTLGRGKLNAELTRDANAAEKLGSWFGPFGVAEMASMLKVRL